MAKVYNWTTKIQSGHHRPTLIKRFTHIMESIIPASDDGCFVVSDVRRALEKHPIYKKLGCSIIITHFNLAQILKISEKDCVKLFDNKSYSNLMDFNFTHKNVLPRFKAFLRYIKNA